MIQSKPSSGLIVLTEFKHFPTDFLPGDPFLMKVLEFPARTVAPCISLSPLKIIICLTVAVLIYSHNVIRAY